MGVTLLLMRNVVLLMALHLLHSETIDHQDIREKNIPFRQETTTTYIALGIGEDVSILCGVNGNSSEIKVWYKVNRNVCS